MPTQPGGVPPHFIVIVPGYTGSKLRDRTTGEAVWVDFASIPKNPFLWDDWVDHLLETMAYPNDNLEPAGMMDEVIYVPPWAKQEHYSRLVKALEAMGYQADPARYPETGLNVYAFDHDWRQDNRISARQLGEAIERWSVHHPGAKAWIIGHSNGGIVARWYIEKEGGKDHVDKLFLMGSPWDGSPKAMTMLFGGLETLFRRRFNPFNIAERSRDLLRTFPSFYQLIPIHDPFLRDVNNNLVDPFSDVSWLDNDQQQQCLLDAQRFNQELGTTLSVETLCFFGRKKPTTTYGVVRFEAEGDWKDIEWHATEAGDGTIAERSAVHPHAHAKLPFAVGHGDIYVNPGVLEFLQWELMDKYRAPERAEVTTPQLSVLFEPNRDAYAPNETIGLVAQVLGPEDLAGQRQPVEGAAIHAQVVWQEPLPGDEPTPSRVKPLRHQLSSAVEPGRYLGQLQAPEQEGYYQLMAVVDVIGQAPITLSESILIEEQLA